MPAIDVDVEEWVHLDYFARDPEACATLVLCPPPARDGGRVRELEPLLQRLGRPYRILTGPALADQFRAAITYCPPVTTICSLPCPTPPPWRCLPPG